jgi:hypothetical protein
MTHYFVKHRLAHVLDDDEQAAALGAQQDPMIAA